MSPELAGLFATVRAGLAPMTPKARAALDVIEQRMGELERERQGWEEANALEQRTTNDLTQTNATLRAREAALEGALRDLHESADDLAVFNRRAAAVLADGGGK